MKKFISICLLSLLLSGLGFAAETRWIQFAPKLYIDTNNTEFVENTDRNNAWTYVKILNNHNFSDINNKKIWYVLGTGYINCKSKQLDWMFDYYDLNNELIKKDKYIKTHSLNTDYDWTVYNFVCREKQFAMNALDYILKQPANNDNQRMINALEDISDELFYMRMNSY